MGGFLAGFLSPVALTSCFARTSCSVIQASPKGPNPRRCFNPCLTHPVGTSEGVEGPGIFAFQGILLAISGLTGWGGGGIFGEYS